MSKFNAFGCLAVLALLSGACGSSATGGNPAPNEGGDDAGFDPANGGDDASPTEDTSPSGDNVSPTSDAATSEDATPDDTGAREHDSGTTPPPGTTSDAGASSSPSGSGASSDAGAKLDTGSSSGGSKKDGGTAVDSGTGSGSGSVKDSGTAVDTGTVVVDTGTTADTGAAVDSAPPPAPSTPPPATPPPATPPSADCAALAADLAARDALPESTLSSSSWYTSSMQGTWGPAAATFPTVATPSGCDRVTFQRDRVLAAAKHYTGLPYQHHHVPAWNPSSAWSGAEGVGLDCSNYTSWVYNFGLGIKFTSNVVDQSNTAGRLLSPSEPLQPGDLLYITTADGSAIGHVVIYVDADTIIDDTSSAPAVGLRAFTGWYKTRFSHARRVIE